MVANKDTEKVEELNEESVYDITAFLPGKHEEKVKLERAISNRFKDKNGNVIKFVFENVTSERIEELRRDCTKRIPKGRGRQPVEKFDSDKFQAQLALESTVYPDFSANEFLDAYKSPSALEVAKKVLSVPGDYMNWITAAGEANGFDEEIDGEIESIEAAKN
ncbi:phage portal protein [Listeria monocytogenes]|nr:phage portal protein [Listeria monocytogenes]EAG7075375.1 phage portal protein [Listeria monocytogenes]